MHFNYTTALVNGKLLTLLGKDPVEKNSTLFNVAVGHNNSYFVADLQSVFGESYVYNSSIKEQLTPNGIRVLLTPSSMQLFKSIVELIRIAMILFYPLKSP